MYEKIAHLYLPRYTSCVSLYTGQKKLGITNFELAKYTPNLKLLSQLLQVKECRWLLKLSKYVLLDIRSLLFVRFSSSNHSQDKR